MARGLTLIRKKVIFEFGEVGFERGESYLELGITVTCLLLIGHRESSSDTEAKKMSNTELETVKRHENARYINVIY